MGSFSRPTALVCAVLALAGCTSDASEPSAAASQAPTECVLTEVTAESPVERGLDLSEPFAPQVTWDDGDGPDADEVVGLLPPSFEGTGPSDPEGEQTVTEVLTGAQGSTSTIVGYSAGTVMSYSVAGTCADGATVRAELTAWTSPEAGAVSCGTPLPASAPDAARATFDEHCPADEG